MASAVGALFLSQLQQFVLATGASAAVQNLVEAGALALAVTVYGLRLRPRSAGLQAPGRGQPATRADSTATGRPEHGRRTTSTGHQSPWPRRPPAIRSGPEVPRHLGQPTSVPDA